MKKFLETGIIVGTHGVRGEVKVQPWSDSSEFLCEFDEMFFDCNGQNSFIIESARPHKNIVLMKISGVDSIESAEKLRGKTLYINREDIELSEGTVFIQDLLGCHAFDEKTGENYGEITDVFSTGANDVWQITKSGKNYLLPAIEQVIGVIDTQNRRVEITPMAGIFDPPEEIREKD